jgi:hypothetical protein
MKYSDSVPLDEKSADGIVLGQKSSYSRPLTIEEKYFVEEPHQKNDVGNYVEFFMKAIVNGNVYHCMKYKRQSRRKIDIIGTKLFDI